MIQQINWAHLKQKVNASDIKEAKSFAVIADGEFLCYVVVPQTNYIRHHVEELMILGNSIGGQDLPE